MPEGKRIMLKNEVREQFELTGAEHADFNVEKSTNGSDLILTNETAYPGVRVTLRDADIRDGNIKIIAQVIVSVPGLFAYARFDVKKNVVRGQAPIFIDDIQRYNRGYNGEPGGGFSRVCVLDRQFKADLVAKLMTLVDVGDVQEVAASNEVDLAEELGDAPGTGKGKGNK